MTEIILQNIQNQIYTIRNVQVMLDKDLAELYGVETKRVNEAVKNNVDKFQADFYFELTNKEFNDLRSKFSATKFAKTKTNPKFFTEQGIYMLATILKGKVATDITVALIRTFANMRRAIVNNTSLQSQIDYLTQKQITDKIDTEQKFGKVFNAIRAKDTKPTQGIYYNGETFDAYVFVCNLIKNAKIAIVLIDNYVDESVLPLLNKRNKKCSATIYTNKINKQLQLDPKKHNSQYPTIKIQKFKKAHDRFLVIDNTEIYHIGASIKDLGKTWFAFTKLEIDTLNFLNQLYANGECKK